MLTIFRALLEKRLNSFGSQVQIVSSLFLGYYIFPNKFRFLGWFFFVKVIEIHKALKSLRLSSLLLNSPGFNYLAFVYDIIRYSVLEYIVLGIGMMLYRYFTDCKMEPLPPNYTIMYQLVVTASTIGTFFTNLGYGDIVPKSQEQIIFLTYAIPILCGSFVVYINHLIDSFTNTFLA